jgi:iron complex transport system permease protein
MSAASSSALRVGPLSVLLRPRAVVVCIVLLLAALALGIVLLGTGTLPFSAREVIAGLFGTGDNATAERVILRVRLPRLVTAIFVGASLGMAGSIFQSISRNALGSPDVIGFTTQARCKPRWRR